MPTASSMTLMRCGSPRAVNCCTTDAICGLEDEDDGEDGEAMIDMAVESIK